MLLRLFRLASAHLLSLQWRHVFPYQFPTNLPRIFHLVSAHLPPLQCRCFFSALCCQQRFGLSSAWLPRIFPHCNAEGNFEAMCSMNIFVAFASASAILPSCFRRFGQTQFIMLCEKNLEWAFLKLAICLCVCAGGPKGTRIYWSDRGNELSPFKIDETNTENCASIPRNVAY